VSGLIGVGGRGVPLLLEPNELRGSMSAGGAEAGGSSFADLLKRAVNDASGMQDESKELIAAFLRGEPVELHQVMAASEEAAISLEVLVEIRNKLTDAYRSIMNTQ
jgi:flagellar hook-basal body complex protein FliE